MKYTLVIAALTTFLTFVACGSGVGTSSANVYDGPVDQARLLKTVDATVKVTSGMWPKWDDAYPIMLETVGKETATEGDMYYWAYMAGADCIQAEVKKDGENFAGMQITGPISKKFKDTFESCTKKTKK